MTTCQLIMTIQTGMIKIKFHLIIPFQFRATLIYNMNLLIHLKLLKELSLYPKLTILLKRIAFQQIHNQTRILEFYKINLLMLSLLEERILP